ncbi:MAG TPA: hypothetical protein PK944_08715, partial [Agitococcus sp.]|nr:hypothetical protein [Agitococcus sp.]
MDIAQQFSNIKIGLKTCLMFQKTIISAFIFHTRRYVVMRYILSILASLTIAQQSYALDLAQA